MEAELTLNFRLNTDECQSAEGRKEMMSNCLPYIMEMVQEGFREGELHETWDDEDYYGKWEVEWTKRIN